MIAENLFRDRLVFAKHQSTGPASGEWHAAHRKVRDDVLIEGAVVFELVRQVKNHIWRELLQLLLDQIEIIKDGEIFTGVTELAERVENVGFSFPIIGL